MGKGGKGDTLLHLLVLLMLLLLLVFELHATSYMLTPGGGRGEEGRTTPDCSIGLWQRETLPALWHFFVSVFRADQ